MKPCLSILAMLVISFNAAYAQVTPVQVTFGDKHDCDPAVSPDGKHLAFASDRTGNYDIYVQTFSQAGVTQLSQGKKDDRYPAWSSNSKKIVFSSKRTGKGDLYETALDGSGGFLQLTDRADLDMYPNYTKSGDGLLFVTAPKKPVQLDLKTTIVLSDEKGRANNARLISEGEQPRFSPDGKKIVFVSERTKNKDIWIMNTDGGAQTQLTSAPKDDENPAFSPHGTRIIFASKRTGNYDIWIMETDGGNQRQLTSSETDETQPVWGTDDYIYFTLDESVSSSHIYRIPAP